MPRQETNLSVFSKTIHDMSIVNSTNSSFFYTGILWDSSDDGRNGGKTGEYDTTDKEDIVFVTEATRGATGKYGVYDYEIKFPASLRSYISTDFSSVSLYAELI
jgi:hypothetical protein